MPGKFGVLGVLLVVPCAGFFMGTLSGLIIVRGRLQPFIVTLAMMVAVLGVARLMAGQDTAVYTVYTGSNATAESEVLRSVLLGVLPVPGLLLLVLIGIFIAMLQATTFGRYVYAIGGNEEATRLSGVNVDRVKVTVYAFSGMLAALAGVLYVAQYRQGKPDAGREQGILFLGVDALPDEGVRWVHDDEIAATFLYPTPGAEGLRQGLKLLAGEPIKKKIVLGTETVTKENAGAILKANGLL